MDIVYAMVAACMFGGLTVAIRWGLERTGDAVFGAVVPGLIALGVIGAAVLVSLGFRDQGDVAGLWRFALGGLLAPGGTQIVVTRAVQLSGASRTGILISASPVLAAALAIVALGEPIRLVLAISTFMIVAGSMVLAWPKNPSRTWPFQSSSALGLVLGLLAAVLIGAQANVFRWASSEGDVSPFLAGAAAFTSAAALLCVYLMTRGKGSVVVGLARASKAFFPAGVLAALSYVTLLLAYEHGRVTVVAPLAATQGLWAVLLATVLLGVQAEAITTRVLVAGLLVVGGSALVGIFR